VKFSREVVYKKLLNKGKFPVNRFSDVPTLHKGARDFCPYFPYLLPIWTKFSAWALFLMLLSNESYALLNGENKILPVCSVSFTDLAIIL